MSPKRIFWTRRMKLRRTLRSEPAFDRGKVILFLKGKLCYTCCMMRFNENNEVITEEKYRAILVGAQLDQDISYSMEELSGLAEAAGIEPPWPACAKNGKGE